MPAPKIQINYDDMQSVSTKFSNQADVIAQMKQQIQSKMDALTNGGWIGQGANTFSTEMDEKVMPTIQKLHDSLEAAAFLTGQIMDHFHQVEQDASALFKK